ncbi:Uncharacterised protein [Vibrio cholerae]|nr:Uncharacterised protein [Vibrio cholerae]CSA57172.1 Uncharacterised protein [Vibrio cholerae]CSC18109.1 Uncharacterised protein [Vibrio cholerae]
MIFSAYATNEPAPEPRPGPTGISLSFDHWINSITIKKYPGKPIWLITSSSTCKRSSYSGRRLARTSGSGKRNSSRSSNPSRDFITRKSSIAIPPVGKLGRKYSPKRTVTLQRLAISTLLANASGMSANSSHISASLRRYCFGL